MSTQPSLPGLEDRATRLRIHSIRATTAAGSGHPTSCCSAADLVAALFFDVMRFRPAEPHAPDNDRMILSKGHAAPLLYAAWAEAGALSPDELLTLRRLDSDLEGHPTPRLPFVEAARRSGASSTTRPARSSSCWATASAPREMYGKQRPSRDITASRT